MKLLAIILAVFSMAFNAPQNCAHALGLAKATTAVASTETDTVDHAVHTSTPNDDHAMHAMHGGHDNETLAPIDHEEMHGGCTDDCNGGVNCDGCAMASAAIVTVDQYGRALQVSLGRNITAQYGIERATKIDTPPPRGFEA
jgi:hypothetical protein